MDPQEENFETTTIIKIRRLKVAPTGNPTGNTVNSLIAHQIMYLWMCRKMNQR